MRVARQGAMRKGGIARAENQILTKLDVELLLERVLHVDLRQDAKALGLEGCGHPFERLRDRYVLETSIESVSGHFVVHRIPPSI
jgi:hypothetical protein